MCYCTAVLTSTRPSPRWLKARAARLSAAVVEGIIEVHGHAALIERLADVAFGRALAAALALPDENDLGAVARALSAGLRRDEARLGVTVDPAAGVVTLADRTVSPLFCIDGERVIRLRPARAAVNVERRLGAALLVSHARRPFTSEPLGNQQPGRGPRELFALALLSDLIIGDSPPPELTRLALGSACGSPFGVPLLIYDEVLRSLEGLLHGTAGNARFRLWPLVGLYEELARAEERAAPHRVARFVRREQRFARDLWTRTVDDDDVRPRPPPRRPARKVRRPLSWRPPEARPRSGAGQRDLFAP